MPSTTKSTADTAVDKYFEALTESKRSLVCQIRAFRRRLDSGTVTSGPVN